MEKMRILVVDDNTVNLATVEQELKEKYEVIPMLSGRRAVKYLYREKVDLILLDVQMPIMDGIETLKTIRTQENGVTVPVIFLTTKKDKLTVKLQKLTQSSIAAMLSISEESRRMNDMMKMYAMSGMPMSDMPVDETLILNTEHPLVQYLIEHRTDEAAKETVDMISEQLYDLAKLQQSPLSADEMTKFISRSNEILLKMAK